MAKTGVDQAVTKVAGLNRYLAVWTAKMSIGASPAQLLALSDLARCVLVFLQNWHKATPVN
jgi:hypothetical protein